MILRTPDARFEGLADFPFAPQYSAVDDPRLGTLRIARVDEGPRDGAVVLLMHGEPTWSYLYRKMIPPLVAAGHRVIAPDLIGFGRSDKPAAREDYSYAAHVAWMSAWLTGLDLRDITLFCQDWGGLIGLRLVATFPDRFSRVCVSNSFLPTGGGKASDAFLAWRRYSQEVPVFDSGRIVAGAVARGLSAEAMAAYNAPFPDESYKAGARAFPTLVPVTPDMLEVGENRAAWEVLARFDKPLLTLFGDSDPITSGGDKALQQRIPGAQGQPHRTMERTGHFCQEDAGADLAAALIAWIAQTSHQIGESR